MQLSDYKTYQHGVIFRGAPHTEYELSPEDCKQLLAFHKGLFIRNTFDWDCKGPTSFWYIIQDHPISLEDLHPKCRNQVRRSLKTLIIQRINSEKIIEDGYNVYKAAFRRYKIKTSSPMSRELWENIVNKTDDMEFWGAYDRESGKMIAYAEVLIQSNAAKYTALKAIPEDMNRTYPFYGLLFEMNKYYIEEKKLLYVTDGARSVSEHSNIQAFLEKFNFRRAYCRIHVTYIWWLGIVVSLLYPFRRFLGKNNKLSYLLRFEAINRNEY